MMRRYAYQARAVWVDDDGRDRHPPLTLAPGQRTSIVGESDPGRAFGAVADYAVGKIADARNVLNDLGAGYPPLDEAVVTVDVKAVTVP